MFWIKSLFALLILFSFVSYAAEDIDISGGVLPQLHQGESFITQCNQAEHTAIHNQTLEKQKLILKLNNSEKDVQTRRLLLRQIHEADASIKCTYKQ